MVDELKIVPYLSVGGIEFGMKKEDVEALFNRKADSEYQDYLQRTDMRWENISVKFNKKGFVNEVSFVSGKYKPVYDGVDILSSNNTVKLLNTTEKPLNTVGFKVYFKTGIALTGFGKNKEEKTISVFSKELIKLWKK